MSKKYRIKTKKESKPNRNNHNFFGIYSLAVIFFGVFIFYEMRKSVRFFGFKNAYYYDRQAFSILCLLTAIYFVFYGIFVGAAFIDVSNKSEIKKLFSEKKKRFLLFLIIGLALGVTPFLTAKSGIIADEISIKKVSVFGNVKQEYLYTDIEHIELNVRFGIQYNITYKNGKKLGIYSHKNICTSNFESDESLISFNEYLKRYADIEIVLSIRPLERYFFNTDEGYNHFKKVFQIE